MLFFKNCIRINRTNYEFKNKKICIYKNNTKIIKKNKLYLNTKKPKMFSTIWKHKTYWEKRLRF